MRRRRGETSARRAGADTDVLRTVIGAIEMDRDEHVRCAHCIRFRRSRREAGRGYCSRPLYDERGRYLGRANEDVAETHRCEHFLSRLGEQQ